MPKRASMASLASDPDVAAFINGTDNIRKTSMAVSPSPVTPPEPPVAAPTIAPEAQTQPKQQVIAPRPSRRRQAASEGDNEASNGGRATYKVDPEVHLKLRMLALRQKRPVFELVNEALAKYLKAHDAA